MSIQDRLYMYPLISCPLGSFLCLQTFCLVKDYQYKGENGDVWDPIFKININKELAKVKEILVLLSVVKVDESRVENKCMKSKYFLFFKEGGSLDVFQHNGIWHAF